MKVGVVVNPAAGGGRMDALWSSLAPALEAQVGAFDVHRSTGVQDASDAAHAFARNGYELVIAAGGDGTASEVVDGLMHSSAPRPGFAMIPVGTGMDFGRNFSFGTDPYEAIIAIGGGRMRQIDVGRVQYTSDDGGRAVRYFLNTASLGLSGPVARSVNRIRSTGRRTGRGIFLWRTLVELLRYQSQRVQIVIDEEETLERDIIAVVACNGRYFGAGMKVAPLSELDDGLLDVVVAKSAPKLRLLPVLARLYAGAHLEQEIITFRKARTVEVSAPTRANDPPALIEIDGESPGRAPARFDVVPGALTLFGTG